MTKSETDQLAARIKQYQRDPRIWVQDYFGENLREECEQLTGVKIETVTGLTMQQEDYLVHLGKLIGAKLDRHFGRKLTKEQEEYADKIGISIQAAQGVGKDFIGALSMLFFLSVFADTKGLATANTAKQLRNVYWAEISKIMRLSKKVDPSDPQSETILQQMFEWQSEKVFYKPSGGKEWFAEAVTVNAKSSPDEQATALAGRHEKYMFFVVDEASDVPDGVMNPLEGTLTGIVNLILLIFNPTRVDGYAANSQKDDSRYVKLQWSGIDSEIVPQSKIDADRRAHGEDSNYFRIRCLGLPPVYSNDRLIPYEWIQSAIRREIRPLSDDPVIAGIDPGAGGDNSAYIARHGGKVISIHKNHSPDTMEVVSWAAARIDEDEAVAGMVDPIGIGHGVYCRLKELKYKVYPCDVRKKSEKVVNGHRFKRLRDELWWRVRTAFEEGVIEIPDDPDLVRQLGCIGYTPQEDGTIKVDTKKEIKSNYGRSPDEADALMMTYYKSDKIFRKSNKRDGNKIQLRGVYLR